MNESSSQRRKPVVILDGAFKYDDGEHMVTCLACGWFHRAQVQDIAENLGRHHRDGTQADIPKCRGGAG